MNKRSEHNTDFTRLFIVRHAQTAQNAQGKIQGDMNGPINEVGIQQAKKLGRHLSRFYKIDHILCSPFLRAQNTAGIIAENYNLEIEVREDLTEINFGKIANQSFAALETIARPAYYKGINAIFAPDSTGKVKKPAFEGGESFTAIAERIQRFTDYILDNYRGQCVALVTHGALTKYTIAYYAGMALDEPIFLWIENASLSIVDFYNHRPVLRTINDITHLDQPFGYARPSVI